MCSRLFPMLESASAALSLPPTGASGHWSGLESHGICGRCLLWEVCARQRKACIANKPNPPSLTVTAVHAVCKAPPPRIVAPLTLDVGMFYQLDRNDIAGWCDSPGALATWNIFRRGFADEDDHSPDAILDHSRYAAGDVTPGI